MVVILAAAGVAIAQIVGLFLAGKVVIAYFERKQAEIIALMNAELTLLLEGKPCQSAGVLNAIAQNMGRVAGQSVRAGIMSDLGKVSRDQNSAGDEQQLALISDANPLVAQFLGSMGKRGSSKMLRNPLVQLLMGALMPKGNAPASHPADNGQRSFSL